ncbi:MAG: alanine racemase [Bacillota bacterium]|nr:alanine racemase [Bacillota bacterium]
MYSHCRSVWAEVNLDNLEFNMQQIRSKAKSKDIIAVIKADGYGHGALDIADTLIENGATRFAVAVASEAIELRKKGYTCPIMILGFSSIGLLEDILNNNVEQTVYSYEYAEYISKTAEKLNVQAKIHIAVDTGMGRIGFIPNDDSAQEIYKISKLPNIVMEGIFSHFSTADEENKEYAYNQLNKFNSFNEKLDKKGVKINIKHIANSAAIMEMPDSHLDAVRPGIILYGYYPSKQVLKENLKLKPVLSLKANIAHIKKLPIGESISYGRKFKTDKESIIATITIGYADGYTRLLFNKAKVIINGTIAPVVGNICMDQCMIDVTNVKDVKLGDEVILIGEDGNLIVNAETIADSLGTISYEVLCMISRRIPRVYLKNNKVINVRDYV